MMRGRIALLIVLAVVVALAGVFVGRSTNTPKAIGEPATPTDSPVESPKASTPRVTTPRATTPKATTPRVTTPRVTTPRATTPRATTPKATTPKATTPKATTPKLPVPSGEVRFGKVTTTPSGDTVDTSIAESDRRALTTVFSDRVVQGGPGATEPATRSFAMTMPLTDGAKGETLRAYVQGYAFVQERGGAYARLTLKLNGQGTVKYYPSGFDNEVFEVLEAPATPGTTYQLSGVLEVLRRDPGTNGEVYLNVLSIDASIS
jgi:hypothetical protein